MEGIGKSSGRQRRQTSTQTPNAVAERGRRTQGAGTMRRERALCVHRVEAGAATVDFLDLTQVEPTRAVHVQPIEDLARLAQVVRRQWGDVAAAVDIHSRLPVGREVVDERYAVGEAEGRQRVIANRLDARHQRTQAVRVPHDEQRVVASSRARSCMAGQENCPNQLCVPSNFLEVRVVTTSKRKSPSR